MAAIKELLLRFLEELVAEKLSKFKWYLTNNKSISAAAIENANATGTVDLMVARFTPEGAVKVMLEILRKMNENYLAEQLENEYKDVQMSRDPHTVDLNLQLGETVNAPVLTRSNIPNPVAINFSSSSGAVGCAFSPVGPYFRPQKTVDPVVKFPSAGLKIQRKTSQDLEIKQYACYLTLDPNTAHPNLFLSERNRKVTHVREKQPYPDHPERFDWQPQVLCKESLSARHYWEVEWSTRMWVEIAVTYKGTRFKGADNDFLFSRNARSWVLKCSRYSYLVYHNNHMTNIPASSPSTRVGVYVDVSAGILSFYNVSYTNTLTHLHTFNTTFTEPLYAGFLLQSDCSVALCEI